MNKLYGNLDPIKSFESIIGTLPPWIQAAYNEGKLQYQPGVKYANKAIGALTQFEPFQAADSKTIVQATATNVNKRQLDTDEWFLMTHIRLMSCLQASPTTVGMGWTYLPDIISNGHFINFRIGDDVVLPDLTPLSIVIDGRSTSIAVGPLTSDYGLNEWGFYELPSPKLVAPQKEIKVRIETPIATVANTYFRMELHGVQIGKN